MYVTVQVKIQEILFIFNKKTCMRRAVQITISGCLSSFSPDWYPVVSRDNWTPSGQASSGVKLLRSRSFNTDDS